MDMEIKFKKALAVQLVFLAIILLVKTYGWQMTWENEVYNILYYYSEEEMRNRIPMFAGLLLIPLGVSVLKFFSAGTLLRGGREEGFKKLGISGGLLLGSEAGNIASSSVIFLYPSSMLGPFFTLGALSLGIGAWILTIMYFIQDEMGILRNYGVTGGILLILGYACYVAQIMLIYALGFDRYSMEGSIPSILGAIVIAVGLFFLAGGFDKKNVEKERKWKERKKRRTKSNTSE